MPRDNLDPLDPRFPIELGPRCDLFWAALATWQAYPSHAARAFATDEAAAAVEQITRREETFTRPVHDRLVWALPLGTPDDAEDAQFVQVPMSQLAEDPAGTLRAPPVPYPALDEDTLTREFEPLPLEPLP